MRPNYHDGSGMSLQQDTSRSLFPFGRDRPSSRNTRKGRRSKLFFALKFSDDLSLRIHDDTLRHAAGRTHRPAYPANLLHMTLLCMEEFYAPPYHLMPKIEQAMADIRARPIRIVFDRSAIFGKKQHLVLTGGDAHRELPSFVRMLHAALSRHNLPRYPATSFKPHVTVIYDCGRIKPMPVPEPYTYTASEFVLIYSHYGETRHEECGRWHFSATAPPYPRAAEQFQLLF